MPLETNLRSDSNRVSPFVSKQQPMVKPTSSDITRFIPSMKVSVFLLVILQVITIILVINPINVLSQLNVVNIINEVSKQATIPPTEVPVVAVIGDNKLLPNIDDIKKQNDFAADIYKDAQNGDYVLAYSSKMVIYRVSENKVLYEGDTPAAKQTKLQEAATEAVIAKAKEAGLIQQGSTEKPGLSVIVDLPKVQAANPTFYANAQKDDIIATFSDSKVLLIYRAATQSIINSGTFTTMIQ